MEYDVAVIGGGAAGMMAAITAAQAGAHTVLIEGGERLGKKLFITGKGRCNLTNACDTAEFFDHVNANPRFLYSPIYDFDAAAVMQFVESLGCPLKTERGERVFPVSDRSADVINALERALRKYGVDVKKNTKAAGLLRESAAEENPKKYRVTGVFLDNGDKISAKAVIAATGGVSYSSTGSDGSFFQSLMTLGHTVTALHPALVPLVLKEETASQMMGLSLKNVSVTLKCEKKKYKEGPGEMLFTHFGVSGPLILTLSSIYSRNYGGRSNMLTESFSIKKEYAKKFDKENDFGHNLKNYVEGKEADLYIDLKPGMTEEEIDERLIREISENRKKNYSNLISSFVPGQMKDVFPIIAGIDPSKKADQISREERRITAETLKKMHFTVIGTRDFNEAIVTSGGINVKEVDPSTMQSKLADGLYICGEMLDTDAQTGGYNLQTAWSTGHLAGLCAAGADI